MCDNSVMSYIEKLRFWNFEDSKKDCICDQKVLFFGEYSRDLSHSVYLLLTVHIPDLIGLTNR